MAQSFEPISKENVLVIGELTSPPSRYYFQTHVLNMTQEELKGLTLYKYYTINALKPLLMSQMLFMDRVNSWEDVYENFFLKEKFFSKSRNEFIKAEDIANAVFGQSWTYATETDAMWRIYSPNQNKNGIRIQTSCYKVFNAMFVDNDCSIDTWIGKIQYNSLEAMNIFVKDEIRDYSISSWKNLMPYSQFLKRTEFEHEKEFRFIKMLDYQSASKISDYRRLAFKIDVDSFIEKAVLDPRLGDEEFKDIKQKLIHMGIEESKISRSTLYQFEPITIEID